MYIYIHALQISLQIIYLQFLFLNHFKTLVYLLGLYPLLIIPLKTEFSQQGLVSSLTFSPPTPPLISSLYFLNEIIKFCFTIIPFLSYFAVTLSNTLLIFLQLEMFTLVFKSFKFISQELFNINFNDLSPFSDILERCSSQILDHSHYRFHLFLF